MTISLPFPSLKDVPTVDEPLTRKDFTSDQEVRWCPGCGDYAVLAAFVGFMPELGIRRENTVIISGSGAPPGSPTTSTPTACTRSTAARHRSRPGWRQPDLTSRCSWQRVTVTRCPSAATTSIHTLRRNVNITILLFNNRIYGLTKGQYSPTSEPGKVTKSTPHGSPDHPFNPVLAGARRRGDVRRPHDRLRPQAPDLRAAGGRRASGHLGGGDLPELPDLQRRRLRRTQGPGDGRAGDHPARAR